MELPEIQAAFAKELRRQELQNKLANLQGSANATATIQKRVSALNSDISIQISEVQAQLTALNAGAAPGLAPDLGFKTRLTQQLEEERKAGAIVVVKLLKTEPLTTEAEAVEAWEVAAAAATGQPCIQRGNLVSAAYRTRLQESGATPTNSWEDFATWIHQATEAEIWATGGAG